jgi:26S proteasome regulatory subunit N1
MKRQLAFLIARAQIPLQWLQIPLTEDEAEESFESDLQDSLFNTKLSERFRAFGKDLGVEDARSLEDVYKSHLENTRTSTLDAPQKHCSQYQQEEFLSI